jgi:hypothetical protein
VKKEYERPLGGDAQERLRGKKIEKEYKIVKANSVLGIAYCDRTVCLESNCLTLFFYGHSGYYCVVIAHWQDVPNTYRKLSLF